MSRSNRKSSDPEPPPDTVSPYVRAMVAGLEEALAQAKKRRASPAGIRLLELARDQASRGGIDPNLEATAIVAQMLRQGGLERDPRLNLSGRIDDTLDQKKRLVVN